MAAAKGEEDFFADCENEQQESNNQLNSGALFSGDSESSSKPAVAKVLYFIDELLSAFSVAIVQDWEEVPLLITSHHLQITSEERIGDFGAPNVDCLDAKPTTTSFTPGDAPVKSTIGVRKIQPKRAGMGARKVGGMGATKVANFAELEQRANMADQVKPAQAAEIEKKLTPMEEEEVVSSMRLAYQDLSLKNKKEEERVKHSDPTKAKQMERLGMGINSKRSNVSHSAMSDMSTITQESAPKSSGSSSSAYKSSYNDDYFATSSSTSAFDNFMSGAGGRDSPSSDKEERFDDAKMMGFDTLEPIDDQSSKVQGMFAASSNRWNDTPATSSSASAATSRNNQRVTPGGTKYTTYDDDGEAQNKFANAKSISSEQFFGNSSSGGNGGNESSNRFQGSTSISSDQYFNKQPTSSRSE